MTLLRRVCVPRASSEEAAEDSAMCDAWRGLCAGAEVAAAAGPGWTAALECGE